jgi:hypothetical protein
MEVGKIIERGKRFEGEMRDGQTVGRLSIKLLTELPRCTPARGDLCPIYLYKLNRSCTSFSHQDLEPPHVASTSCTYSRPLRQVERGKCSSSHSSRASQIGSLSEGKRAFCLTIRDPAILGCILLRLPSKTGASVRSDQAL